MKYFDKQIHHNRGQAWFISRIIESGYEINKQRGLCFGIAYLGMRAFLLSEEDRFIERWLFIKYQPLRFFQTLRHHSGYANYSGFKYACSLNSTEYYQRHGNEIPYPTKDKFPPADLYAFFDSMLLLQLPQQYSQLFPEGRYLSQSTKPAFKLTEPVKLANSKEQTEHSNLKPTCIADRRNNYDKEQLSWLLENIASNVVKRVALVLHAKNHAINLNYDPKSETWLLINANNLPGVFVKDCEQLASLLYYDFDIKKKKPETLNIQTEVYVNKHHVATVKPMFINIFQDVKKRTLSPCQNESL